MALFDFLFPDNNIHKKVTPFDPKLTQDFAEALFPVVSAYFRFKVEGLHHLPDEPFIGIGTHGGGMTVPESFLWAGQYHVLRRKPHLIPLVHRQFFNPMFGHAAILPLMRRFGVSEASVPTAEKLLSAGYAIQVYPGGDLDAFRSFKDRNKVVFAGRKGYVRLALRMGKPILPVVAIGGAETSLVLWDGRELAELLRLDKLLHLHIVPLLWSYPNGLRFGMQKANIPFPAQITISVLEPISMEGYSPEDAGRNEIVDSIDELVRRRMQDKMDELAKNRIPVIGKVKF